MIDTVRSAWQRRDPSALAVPLHYLSLAAALVFLLYINRNHWFIADEWTSLTDRKLGGGAGARGIFEPHNEHWATAPVIAYRALFTVFGLKSYMPYIVVLVVVHLAITHLLWRLLRRLGVETLLATVLCGAFAVLGAGADNLSIAWQVQLIAPIATGVGALLVAPDDGPFGRRDRWVWALLVLGLMCSGIGVTMVAVVGFVALLRRGWKVAATTVSLPAAVYLVWFVAYGRDGRSQNPDSLSTAIQKVPEYVWRGLTAAADATFGLAGIGPVVLVALAVWLLLRARAGGSRSSDVALAMAGGAVVFLALTSLRRSGLGIDTAGTSRYAYVVIALLLPASALALDALLSRTSMRLPVVVLLAGLLFLVQGPELNRVAADWTNTDQSLKSRILGVVALSREGEHFADRTPAPQYMPGLTVTKIVRLADEDKLPSGPATPRQVLDARLYTQVRIKTQRPRTSQATGPTLTNVADASVEPGSSPSCRQIVPEAEGDPGVLLEFDGKGSVLVQPGATSELRLRLAQEADGSEARNVKAIDGVRLAVLVEAGRISLRLGVTTSGVTSVCGLSPTSPSRLRAVPLP